MTNIKGLTRAIILVTALFSLNSCKKESEKTSIDNLADLSVRDGRLSFKDSKALKATLDELTNKSITYLDSWENTRNFNSLRRYTNENKDLETFDFPLIYSTIINSKGEYLVGDTIVWYHDGFKHMIPKMDEYLLAKIKINPTLSKIKFTAGSNNVANRSFTEGRSFAEGSNDKRLGLGKTGSVMLNAGAVDARYQKEFKNDFGHDRKIVIEIFNYVDGGPLGYSSYLYTRVKQYYKGSGSYKPAGEAMKKYITNLTYTKGYNSIFNGAYLEVSGTIPAIPASGPQIDGNNLEYMIASTIGAYSSTYVSVSANYEVLVVAPHNSQGFYNMAANW